jgi:hypothetical protein
MVVHCTRRALTLLGEVALHDPPASEEDWYLNLLWLDRRKCLLLTPAGTLFAVLIPDVRAAQLRPPGPLLVRAVQDELRAEQLPPDTFGPLDPETVVLAKTASRSVLGFVNDMAHFLRRRPRPQRHRPPRPAAAPNPLQPRRLYLPDRARRQPNHGTTIHKTLTLVPRYE